MSNSSIWLIDRTLSGATIPGQSGTGNDGNEGVLRIPQSSNIIGDSRSDCLVLVRWSYPSAEMHSVYSTAPADWVAPLLKIPCLTLLFSPYSCLICFVLRHVYLYFKSKSIFSECPRGIMVKVGDCVIVVSEFELQSRYNVQITLGKARTPYPRRYGLNDTTNFLLGESLWN